MTFIGNGAFYDCSALTEVTIPNSVTSIGSSTFRGCSALTAIAIPNSITSIGNDAFSWCSALAAVTIPNSVTSIGNYAFSNCSVLTAITIPNSVTSIGNGVFNNCYKLTAITIPNSVTSIRSYAFNGCIKLTVVTIPNSVTSIGNYAFSECSSLTTVTIGKSVTSIGNSAFNFTNSKGKMVEIISLIEEPKSISQDTFSDGLYKNASLYVPKGTMEKYKACTGWKDFVFIEEGTGSGTGGGMNPTTETCANPTINYSKGKLTFSCETEGATCHSDITNADIASYSTNEVELDVTYNISVYAAKAGWYNSETVTATLCWIDQEPKTEGMETGIAQVAAKAVLIQSEGGIIHVQGAEDGTPISVYGINGSQAGSAISQHGTASINTSLQSGSIAIVKVGQKSIKVIVK